MAKIKSPVSIWIEYFFFRAFLCFANYCPSIIAYPLMGFFGRIAYYVAFIHRNRVIKHLMHAGVAKTETEAKKIAKKNFIHFSKVILDIFTSPSYLTKEKLHDVIKLDGTPETLDFFFGRPNNEISRQAIVVTAHFGNWEIAGNGYTMLTGRRLMTIMRPFDNPLIGEHFYKLRQSEMHRLCPKEGALRSLMGAVKKGESICLISDQHAGHLDGVETLFFGKPARTHASAALMHLKTGIPILAAISHRLDDHHHFIFDISPPIQYTPTNDKQEDLKAIAQLYTTALENLIRKRPEQWLWAHRRWLDLREQEREAKHKKKMKASNEK